MFRMNMSPTFLESKKKIKQETSSAWYLLHAGSLHLAYSSTMKMKAICSSETSVDFNGLRGVISKKIKYARVGHKTGPCTATIDDLLCILYPRR
jgi:hypothetical protein